MKYVYAALVFVFFAAPAGFAQIQPGNASYNAEKTGLTISHPSLSFNTHVRVTNLRNNRSVEAIVTGRIPPDSERIADISRDAGDLLGMSKTALTPVQIEIIPSRGSAAEPDQPQSAAGAPPPSPSPPRPAQAAARTEPPPPAQDQAAAAPAQIPPVQPITTVQYVPVPGPGGTCCNTPLMVVVLILLIVAIILLLLILILLLRRLLLWPWRYKVWYRRHLLLDKKRRI
jgi:hypothetical protein